jgi:predicted dinucleotide-binding enzyme
MAAKKTVAIIASANEKAAAIVNKLSLENSRLLVVSKQANQFIELSTDIKSRQPNLELDVIDCMKDGCWEADIIILDIPYDAETEVAALIKEVSTQKIVVSFSENENSELQNLLKYSKVVTAINIINSSCISLSGKYQDAIEEVSNILKNSEQSKVTI